MNRLLAVILQLFVVAAVQAQEAPVEETKNIPIATQWVLDAVGPTARVTVNSIYLIVCTKTSSKGSGFLVDSGVIVTNEHVVRGCTAGEVIAFSSSGQKVEFSAIRVDATKDLAVLSLVRPMKGGLRLARSSDVGVGTLVRTWGFPLGYNGPAPLLSVGYLSGFRAQMEPAGSPVKRLIVNAAFNSGNSGGPLFVGHDTQVVGVVATKAVPNFTPFVESAVRAFANNKSGVVFSGTDASGQPLEMVESQVVAEVVNSLRDMAQVVIGEAVAVEELAAFLGYKYSDDKSAEPK